MDDVRQQIKDRINRLRADVTTLTAQNIKTIIGLYDKTFFSGQIAEKLKTDKVLLTVNIAARETTPATTLLFATDLVKKPPNNQVYVLEIAPRTITKIAQRHGYDYTSTLMMLIEHEIIHLLMKLWKYEDRIPAQRDIYGSHGKLFQCMLETYFGYVPYRTLHDLGVSIEPKNPPPSETIDVPSTLLEVVPGYKWYAESCYIDSLLIAMFYASSNYWRDKLFESDVSRIDYGKIRPCDVSSQIDTPEKIQALAARVQKQLKADYLNLQHPNVSLTCTMARSLLAACQPSMKEEGKWIIYNISAIYELLASLFMMEMTIPVELQFYDSATKKHVPAGATDLKQIATIGMIDYLTDPFNPTDTYPLIKWNLVGYPVLVFQNGGVTLEKLNEVGRETTEEGEVIDKKRAFGETILDGRYRLVAVALLLSDAHYVSYFRSRNGEWYSYNDLGARAQKIDEIPSAVWSSVPGSIPELYFYERTPEYETIVTIPPPRPIYKKVKASPVPVVELEAKQYIGKQIDYKAQAREDGYTFVAVMSKDPLIIAQFDKMDPPPITKPSETSRVWRLSAEQAEVLMAQLGRMDAKTSPVKVLPIKASPVKASPIKASPTKTLPIAKSPGRFVVLPGLYSQDYGNDSFVLYGDVVRTDIKYLRELAAKYDGTERKDLGRGMGLGFVFPLRSKEVIINNILTES